MKNVGQDMGSLSAHAGDAEGKSVRKRSRRADRIREVILDVALDSFSDHGFTGTSTRSIAKLAGVQHSLVNYHFETKEKLWLAMMDRELGEFTRRVKAEFSSSQDLPASERLRLYIEMYVKTAASSPQLFRIMTQQTTQNSSRLEWLLDSFVREHFERVIAMIQEGQKEGAVVPGQPEHIFYLIVGGIGIFFATQREYQALTGKDPSAAAEMHKIIDFLCSIVFVNQGR